MAGHGGHGGGGSKGGGGKGMFPRPKMIRTSGSSIAKMPAVAAHIPHPTGAPMPGGGGRMKPPRMPKSGGMGSGGGMGGGGHGGGH